MIILKDFSIGYGDRKLLENINLTFEENALSALIGRNGTGKSTLLRAMASLNHNYSGNILVKGKDIGKLPAEILSKTVAFVNTEKVRIPNLKCRDIVAMGRAPYTNWIGHLQEIDRDIVASALDAVGMQEFANRTMDTMSDGECQRIMIARAIAQTTPVILLDEPTSFLDIPNRVHLVSLLKELTVSQNKTIIFSTHEIDIAQRFCDKIAVVNTPDLYYDSTENAARDKIIQKVFNI